MVICEALQTVRSSSAWLQVLHVARVSKQFYAAATEVEGLFLVLDWEMDRFGPQYGVITERFNRQVWQSR